MLGLRYAARMSIRGSPRMSRKMSVRPRSVLSTMPLKNPEMRPMSVPMIIEIKAAKKPMNNEILALYTNSLNMS